MTKKFTGRAQSGFTMIEVLVALVVTAVGLLGLLKMQALAISSTKESGSRALIAAQTESLTALMHANPLYWAAPVSPGPSPSTFSASGTTVVDASGVLGAATGSCVIAAPGSAAPCSPAALAAYDVQSWASAMNTQFPTYQAKVQCAPPAGSPLPISCTIFVTWIETQVAINASTSNALTTPVAATAKQTTTQSFLVYVQP